MDTTSALGQAHNKDKRSYVQAHKKNATNYMQARNYNTRSFELCGIFIILFSNFVCPISNVCCINKTNVFRIAHN